MKKTMWKAWIVRKPIREMHLNTVPDFVYGAPMLFTTEAKARAAAQSMAAQRNRGARRYFYMARWDKCRLVKPKE